MRKYQKHQLFLYFNQTNRKHTLARCNNNNFPPVASIMIIETKNVQQQLEIWLADKTLRQLYYLVSCYVCVLLRTTLRKWTHNLLKSTMQFCM